MRIRKEYSRKHYQSFVDQIVDQYSFSNVPRGRLFEVGMQGLGQALKNYNHKQGVSRRHYIHWMIKSRLFQFIKESQQSTRDQNFDMTCCN